MSGARVSIGKHAEVSFTVTMRQSGTPKRSSPSVDRVRHKSRRCTRRARRPGGGFAAAPPSQHPPPHPTSKRLKATSRGRSLDRRPAWAPGGNVTNTHQLLRGVASETSAATWVCRYSILDTVYQ